MSSRPAWFGEQTQYHSVSNLVESDGPGSSGYDYQDKQAASRHFSSSSNFSQLTQSPVPQRSWLVAILFQSFAFLWLAPAITLLYLNIHGHIIGATAWCPQGNCNADLFNPLTSVSESNVLRFDKNDHNLLGALQLVAKALEVWFVIIAVSLVYLLTMKLANSRQGIPIGYLTRSVEMPELVSLIDPLLWSTWKSPKHHPQSLKRKLTLGAFLTFSIFLCLLCNVMGPGIAVLVIPTLQWIETPMFGQTSFDNFITKDAPVHGGWAMGDATNCSANDVQQKRWSCTKSVWGASLDAWSSLWVASSAETQESGGGQTISQQGYLSFSFNISATNVSSTDLSPVWIPNRQTIAKFSTDYTNVWNIGNGFNRTEIGLTQDQFDTYAAWNDSLRMQIRRSGPVMGALPNYWNGLNGSWWRTTIDGARSIECYPSWGLGNLAASPGTTGNNYTRCIQAGTGWGEFTKQESFNISGSYRYETGKVGLPIQMTVLSSEKAAYLPNGQLPSGVDERCLVNGTVPAGVQCDWNVFFTPNPNEPNVRNQTQHSNTIFMWMEGSVDSSKGYAWALDYVAYYNFTTYSLDPSQLSNWILTVDMDRVPTTGTPIPVDPNWTLAAWSADVNGTIPSNRSTTLMLSDLMETFAGARDDTSFDWATGFAAVLNIPVLQTLSLLEYTESSRPTMSAADAATHPLLQLNAQIYVWAYGLASRTSILGTVVVIIGCMVAFSKVVLGLLDRRRFRSLTQMLVAALEHQPLNEFDQFRDSESEQARMRFLVQESNDNAGKVKYRSLSSRPPLNG